MVCVIRPSASSAAPSIPPRLLGSSSSWLLLLSADEEFSADDEDDGDGDADGDDGTRCSWDSRLMVWAGDELHEGKLRALTLDLSSLEKTEQTKKIGEFPSILRGDG